MFHWGTIVVTPGYTDPVFFAAGGNQDGTRVTTGESGTISDEFAKAIDHQARRVVQIAQAFKRGQA